MTVGSRAAFPDLEWPVYLNHAAIGPLPAVSRAAVLAALDAQGRRGVAAMQDLAEGAGAVRAHAAALTGHEVHDVALTTNTSEGVTAVAATRAWRPRDHLVLFEGEFPTNTTPWQVTAQARQLPVTWLPLTGFADGSGDGLASLEATLKAGATFVAVSAVQFRTGLRMPVEAMATLCARYDAELFVDAIQGLGAVPMDLSEADYVTCGGQKWLMGPVGTGFFTVRSDRRDQLGTALASWLSHTDPFSFLFEGPGKLTYDRPLAEGVPRVEGGTRNFPGHIGLAASLAVQREVGADQTFAHAQRYLDALEPLLQARGFESHRAADPAARSNILALTPPQGWSAMDLATDLGGRGVSVSTPDGLLRIAPSWPNALSEIPTVTEAVDAALASR